MTTTAAQQPNSQQEPLQLPELNLTRRELEVAFYVAQDYGDTQIADELSIELVTVKKHVASAVFKLRVRGRVGLALWYVRSYGFPPYRNRLKKYT